MEISLSDHFDYKRLFRFVIPSVLMMIFTSLYGLVDGFFVSNYAGKTPFAAINLVIPVTMVIGASGFMLGTGGSAIVARTLGEGKNEKAVKYFSMVIYADLLVGVILSSATIALLQPICTLLGATDEMMPYCLVYGRIVLAAQPAFMLQNTFQSFLVTAEKPKLGLRVTVAAGCTNILGDFLLVGVLGLGVVGAALATSLSQIVGGGVPLIYFARKNTSLLRLVKTGIDFRMIGSACINGSSELLSNISMSMVSMVYNIQLLKVAGEDGVAAYGVIMYAGFLFVAVFIGYSIGVAPLIGFNYGAANYKELQNLLGKSLRIIAVCGVLMLCASLAFAGPLSGIFVGYDEGLHALTATGFRIYNLSTLFMGFNVFGSSFFTALGNGLVSALISFLRTILFQLSAVILLPIFFGIIGIWSAVVVAEVLALCVTAAFLVRMRERYHY